MGKSTSDRFRIYKIDYKLGIWYSYYV